MKVVIRFHPNDPGSAGHVVFDLSSGMTAETFVREINAALIREIEAANEYGQTPDFISGYESGDSEFSEFIQRFTE